MPEETSVLSRYEATNLLVPLVSHFPCDSEMRSPAKQEQPPLATDIPNSGKSSASSLGTHHCVGILNYFVTTLYVWTIRLCNDSFKCLNLPKTINNQQCE